MAPVQPAAVLDCTLVGALRSLTIACALVLASVPAALGALRDADTVIPMLLADRIKELLGPQ